jgi:hypothetical protein
MHLFENGDVLLNLEYMGLARIDARGNVLWTLDRAVHHGLHRDDDGNFWIVSARLIESQAEINRRFFGLRRPLVEDCILQVSPDGKLLKEFSLLELFYGSEYRGLILTPSHDNAREFDVLHTNDVEPLSRAMAAQYPLFSAGDLMVSMREPSVVMVFSPETKTIKWLITGPILHQHDPDFLGDGWISVFDNNSDGTAAGIALGGSRLVAFRPHTGERRQIYPTEKPASTHERRFYTPTGGKSQSLPSGHYLITEATAARVFEIDAEGRTVWEWGHERHEDGKTVSEVLEGTLYEIDAEVVRQWARPR